MLLTTRNITKDPVLADFFNLLSQDGATTAWVPPVDISEQAEAIRIAAEVPGVKPEDVQISLEGNVLTIRGTKQHVEEERTKRVRSEEHTSELQSRLHLVCR